MMRKPTKAAGAVIERDLLRRWIRRERRRCAGSADIGTGGVDRYYSQGYEKALDDLSEWLDAQPQRTKRPGGIGR